MPKWLICVPLAIQWLWLSLRYGSLTLPSCANPAITAGGLVGETKMEYFNSMGATALSCTAPHCVLTLAGRRTMDEARSRMRAAGLDFPLIAKPDMGMCGYGVRLIADQAALQGYFESYPRQEAVVLQQYLPNEGEAGIFYARSPECPSGRVIGLALRYFPQVTGDGVSSIAQLMRADPRARRVDGRADHQFTLDRTRVPPPGHVVRLSTVGSVRIGGLYRDGQPYITLALARAIDAIARDMTAFHFGRFDVRFDDLALLAQGKGFRIMEVNGAGSEAIQAWDPDTGLAQAFRTIFAKQRELFAIGSANRAQGCRPIGLWRLARLHFRQQKLLGTYPPSN